MWECERCESLTLEINATCDVCRHLKERKGMQYIMDAHIKYMEESEEEYLALIKKIKGGSS